MSIQKINFTSSLLDSAKIQNNEKSGEEKNKENQTNNVQEAVTHEEAVQVIPQDVSTIPDTSVYKKTDNTVRNWSVGLGAAAVLIGLGVAGRKGKLGDGFQKLLGGVKKDSKNLADDAAETVTGGSKLKPGAAKEPVVPHVDGVNIKPPEADLQPVTIQKTEVALPKTAEEIDVEKINAAFDRTIPKIDKTMQKVDGDLPEMILGEAKNLKPKDIDPAKIDNDIYEHTLKDGSVLRYNMNKEHTQFTYISKTKGDESLGAISYYDNGEICYALSGQRFDNYYNGILNDISIKVGNKKYEYDGAERTLTRLIETDAKTQAERTTEFDALGYVKEIKYCIKDKDGSNITIKKEMFDNNNNLLSESFYTEKYRYIPEKTIYVDSVNANYDKAIQHAKTIVEPKISIQAEKMLKDANSKYYNDAVEYARLFSLYEGGGNKFTKFFKRSGFSALSHDSKYNVISQTETQIKLQNKQNGTTVVFSKPEGNASSSLFVNDNGVEYNVDLLINKNKETKSIEITRNFGNENIKYDLDKENKPVMSYYQPEKIKEIGCISSDDSGKSYCVSYYTPAQIVSGEKLPELDSYFYI